MEPRPSIGLRRVLTSFSPLDDAADWGGGHALWNDHGWLPAEDKRPARGGVMRGSCRAAFAGGGACGRTPTDAPGAATTTRPARRAHPGAHAPPGRSSASRRTV